MSIRSSLSGLAFKRAMLAGGAALIMAGAAVGVAGAQQATSTPPPGATATARPQGTPGADAQAAQQRYDQFLSTLAGKLGVTVDKLKQAMTDTRTELGVPQNGRGIGPFGGPGGPGLRGRPGFPGGPGGPGRAGGFGFGRGFLGPEANAAAQALGITVDQLRQELPGKSLTDVAKAHNVDPAKVAQALKDAAHTRIDQAVTNGRLTADQATQAKQTADQMIDQLMTRAVPTPPAVAPNGAQGQGYGQGQPGGRGPRGNGQGAQPGQGRQGAIPGSATATASPTI